MAGKTLIIVESPTKAHTIGKLLGNRQYKVIASVGHVRDLPKSSLGIDVAKNFEPHYITIRGKGDVIKQIKEEATAAGRVLLATDPDREGEAIAWHLSHLLKMDPESKCRIAFHEITKDAVTKAVKEPRPINLSLVNSQQARRGLDRLVGYQISPILWKKIFRNLSAGRVQSAALKLICDREKEIRAFVPKEYWAITAMLKEEKASAKPFPARLWSKDGKKLEEKSIKTGEEARAIEKELDPAGYRVKKVEEKTQKKSPYPPFTTSSLQQDASSRLNFQPRRTMSVAQQLYEGITLKGAGNVGLITYMRTDSIRIAEEADAGAKAFIAGTYGKEFVGNKKFSNKKKEVQDAHEAIRPTDVNRTPDSIKDSLTKEQYSLYKLIWERFVASRMADAVFDQVAADIENGRYGFRATGSKMKFEGFRKVYKVKDDTEGGMLKLAEGETLLQDELLTEQKFTQAPPKFTEASLVKELEERGIGRPSTYASIISTLVDRRYVTRDKKTLTPTDIGMRVDSFMGQYFPDIVDAGYTAGIEDRLDQVELGEADWVQVLRDFYDPLAAELAEAEKADDSNLKPPVEVTDETCELCGSPLVVKHGRFGEFLACSNYPDCKFTRSRKKDIEIGVACPLCGQPILLKRSKRGRIFYGCKGYPACKQAYWDKPVDKKCPACGAMLCEAKGGKGGLVCSNPECKHVE